MAIRLGTWKFVPIDGKPDFETGLARLGLKFNFTAMTVGDDAVADDQAKAGAGADRLGGKKWLEQVCLDFRGNTGPIVHNFNEELIVFNAGANTDFAGAIHGVNGVVDEIGPNLVEFAAISQNARH